MELLSLWQCSPKHVEGYTYWFAIPLEGKPPIWVPMDVGDARYVLKSELVGERMNRKSSCTVETSEEIIRELIKIIERDRRLPRDPYPSIPESRLYGLLCAAQKTLNPRGLNILYETLCESIRTCSTKKEGWGRLTWCKLLETFHGSLPRSLNFDPNLETAPVYDFNKDVRDMVLAGLKGPVKFVVKRSLGF